MNSSQLSSGRCHVVGAEKLSAESGGSKAICDAVDRAAAQASAPPFSVEVRVMGPSMLSATATTADGRILPEQKMAVSDGVLRSDSIDRFATALVGAVARAHKD